MRIKISFILIGIGILIFVGSISNMIIVSNNAEVKINEVNCYDNYNNIIKDVSCIEKEYVGVSGAEELAALSIGCLMIFTVLGMTWGFYND